MYIHVAYVYAYTDVCAGQYRACQQSTPCLNLGWASKPSAGVNHSKPCDSVSLEDGSVQGSYEFLHTHTHTHIYMYVYRERERERESFQTQAICLLASGNFRFSCFLEGFT